MHLCKSRKEQEGINGKLRSQRQTDREMDGYGSWELLINSERVAAIASSVCEYTQWRREGGNALNLPNLFLAFIFCSSPSLVQTKSVMREKGQIVAFKGGKRERSSVSSLRKLTSDTPVIECILFSPPPPPPPPLTLTRCMGGD